MDFSEYKREDDLLAAETMRKFFHETLQRSTQSSNNPNIKNALLTGSLTAIIQNMMETHPNISDKKIAENFNKHITFLIKMARSFE